MKTRNKKAPHYATQYGAMARNELPRGMTRRPLALAISRSFVPAWAVGGAMLLSSAMAQGTVIGEGEVHHLPGQPLDMEQITLSGGSLIVDPFQFQTLAPSQALTFVSGKTSTVAAQQAALLAIGGGLNIQGAAQFGTDGQEGQVVLERNIPVSIGNLASLNVAGGTLKNGMGSSVLSEITSQIAETRVGPNATLDFVESAGHIKNLQGAGTVITSYDGLQPLTIEQGNYAGWIRGTSELRKTSTGTLTLSGTRGYVGPITIAGGTLELSSQGTYGNPGLAVVNNGRLVLNQFHGGVLGDISGTGGIEVTGQSLAGLGGVNTYSGTTTIDQGSTLLSFNGIGFPSQGRVLGTGAVVNNGELSLQYTGTVVIDNQISGVGKLSASDAGHVTLTANNTYSGETQIIGGGTLEVGNGGTTGSVGTGAVFTSPGATLIFNRSNDFSVDGVISIYQSTMAKIGAGKMTILGGLATNAGRVEVREGALHFGDGGTRGWAGYMDIDAAQGAELGFNHSDDMTLSGTLTGHGRLNQLGTGKLYFSADGSAFTGDTVVNGGELLMWGGSLGGTVTVNRGGRIQGNGSVGTTDVLAGGMLVSSGFTRLRVNGDLSLKDGSTVRYYLGTAGADGNSAGTTGTTRVSGNLDLNAKLQVRDNGQPTIGYYRLFTYGGTLSGTGLVLDTVPTGHSRDQVSVDTSRTGVVDLRVAPAGAPESLLAWRGGSGVWGAGNMQWQADGQSGWSGEWGAQHAVFSDAPGFVSVSGIQSFKGLQFVSDGWQIGPLAGAGGALQTAPDGSELRVLAGVTASIGAPIQGSGGLDKTGGGTLVLDGANNHTGGTRLSEGVLSVSQDASLGDASGGLTFNGGTLRVTGQSFSQTSRNLQWSTQGGAFDIASASNRFTVGQALSGAGDLVKLGAGTLVLTGTNAYGNTRVEAGTLVGNTDSIRGNLLNNGFVVFDQAASGTFGGDISGSGEATKAGAGVLTLSGRSAQNWRVTAGTLAASGGALSGNVDLGAAGALHLDAPQSSTYSGVLSGTGGLSKTGAGMLALTGDSAGFAGTTRIDQGILSVGINGQGKLGGQVTVARDAVLQGTGTVGGTTVQAGGIIAPGNSIGTLRVAGDLTLEAGSVYRVEADSQSNESDRIAVSGTANLGGSVLHVGPDGNLAGERSYTILTANRINGAFDSASSAFAYLDANLGYDAQAVTLRLDRKRVPVEPTTPSTPGTRPMRFADAAGTSNQRAAANALDSLSGANPLYQYVLTLPEGAPAGVFDSLSGEAHASVTSGLNNLSGLSRNLPFKSLRANLDAGLAPGAATAQAGGTSPASALPGSAAQPAWAELVGTWQTLDGNGNASRVDQRTGGVFVGADHAVGGGWRLGGALGYTDSRIRVDANSSKADVDSYSATVYGGKPFQAGPGKINLLVGAGYTWHDVSTTRNVAVAGQQDKLTADYGASTGQLFTEVGYAWPVAERAQLEPFAGVAWSDTRTRGFQESGGLAALSGESNRNSLTTTTLGLRGKTAFSAGKTEGVLRAAAGWRHAFGDVESRTRLAFNGSQPFTVSGAPLARDAAFTELGVDIAVSRSATIGITYSGQFGGGNRENAGSVGVTWRY